MYRDMMNVTSVNIIYIHKEPNTTAVSERNLLPQLFYIRHLRQQLYQTGLVKDVDFITN